MRVSKRVLVVSSKMESTSFLSDLVWGMEATSPPLHRNSKHIIKKNVGKGHTSRPALSGTRVRK